MTVLRSHTQHRPGARVRATLRRLGHRRFGALLGGVCLLVAQLAFAAHSHSATGTFSVARAAGSVTTSCPLCAFAAHSPLSTPVSPPLQHAPHIGATVTGPPRVAWCAPALSSPPGRGPPASA